MNDRLIEGLSSFVEASCAAPGNTFGYGIWSHHIKPMLGIAGELARDYGADGEVVAIAVLLHDIAGIRDEAMIADHHVHGAEEAERFLSARSYPRERLDLVKKCILNHRGSVRNDKGSPEELCVADADAIAHMTEIGSLYYVAYVEKGMGIDEGTAWILGKLGRDWDKLSERGRDRFSSRYGEILRALGEASLA